MNPPGSGTLRTDQFAITWDEQANEVSITQHADVGQPDAHMTMPFREARQLLWMLHVSLDKFT